MRNVLPLAPALGFLLTFVVACSGEGGSTEALLDAPQGAGEGGEVGQLGSAGRSSSAEPCPTDFAQANHEPCAFNCQVCHPAESDPCRDGEALSCVDGTWRHIPGFATEGCAANASD